MSNKEKYANWLAKHPASLPLFYQPWWLDTVCAGTWEVLLHWGKDGVELLACWPYQTERKFGFLLLRNPLLTPYLGPYLFTNHKEGMALLNEEANLIDAIYKQLPAQDAATFTCIPGFLNFLPLQHKGFIPRLKLTNYIQLSQSDEALLQQMHPRLSRYIRATNAPNEITLHENETIPEELFKLHHATFKEKNTSYPYSKEFITRVMRAGFQQQRSALFLAKQHNELQAFLWVAWDDDTMYQLLSSQQGDQVHHSTMPRLTWAAIQHAKSLGLQRFDMEGSVQPGIEKFFRKFGGERMYYLAFEKITNPLWQLKRRLIG